MDYKRRIEKLEKRIAAGAGVILLDEIDGVLYKNGEKTTFAEERERNSQAVFVIDDVY